MSELAFNMNGEPFEVPASATGWRVRRMKHKGAPEVVYGRDGLPLVLPIEASVDDLRNAVGTAGRYRVDPVDGHRPIPNAAAGYVFVHDGDAPVAMTNPASQRLPPPSDSIVIEAMRMNTEIARSVVDRFPLMLEAAATLLRAADGAGLPAREPRAVDDDEFDDEEETAPRPGFDIIGLIGQFLPAVLANMSSGGIPGLAEMLDWRKAAAKSTPKAKLPEAAPANEEKAQENAHDAMPPIEPAAMAHFIAVQNELTAEEAAIAKQVASTLTPLEVRAWFIELSKLSVPDAVAKIRSLIGSTKKGTAP